MVGSVTKSVGHNVSYMFSLPTLMLKETVKTVKQQRLQVFRKSSREGKIWPSPLKVFPVPHKVYKIQSSGHLFAPLIQFGHILSSQPHFICHPAGDSPGIIMISHHLDIEIPKLPQVSEKGLPGPAQILLTSRLGAKDTAAAVRKPDQSG